MRIRSDVELTNASDPGCVRPDNEDYFLYIEPEDDQEFARRGRLMVVCDGMGGCNGGEVASRVAAECVREVFLSSRETDPRQVIIEGFLTAQRTILSQAADDVDLRGMGTTCCAVIVRDRKLYQGHIGDSRIYLLREGEIQPLTEDHSLVRRMVREGVLTPEQAERHEQRNVLVQALGMDSNTVAGDFPPEPLELREGDIVLLCTDGLHGVVNERDMELTLQGQPLRAACQELIALAKVRGGPDNITLQMLAIRKVDQ